MVRTKSVVVERDRPRPKKRNPGTRERTGAFVPGSSEANSQKTNDRKRTAPQDSPRVFSVYAGRDRLGSIKQYNSRSFVALAAPDNRRLGTFPNAQEATAAINAAQLSRCGPYSIVAL
jgi:hypothetical protein